MSEHGQPREEQAPIPASWPHAPGAPGALGAPGHGGGRGGAGSRRPGSGRTVIAIVSALAVAGTAIAAVGYTTGSDDHASPVALQTNRATTPTATARPLTSSSPAVDSQPPAPDAQSGEPLYSSPSADSFDWQSLNDSGTDQTPFTQNALLPRHFVDSQGITYAVEAAGEKKCVQSTMAEGVQRVLDQYGCENAMTGSYLVDSSVDKVSSDSDILVSIQIWAFPDSATASKVEKALAGVSDKQFSIWCPTSGAGAAPCNSQNYYHAATWWSLQSDYRYVVEATAVYTNMTQNTAAAYKWEKTATTEAVKEAGPQVYAASQ